MLSTIVSLFYKYNQTCGMCPISLHRAQQAGKNTVKNLALLSWSLMHIVGVFCLVSVILSHGSFFFIAKQHPTIGAFNDQLKVATILITHLTILVECLLTKDNYVEMEVKMHETNQMLAMIGVDVREMERQFNVRFVRKLLLCLSVCWAVEVKIIVGSQNDIQWTKVWYLTIFSLMVTRSRHMQHTFYIDNIAYRTKVIKKQLKKIVLYSKSKDFFANERNMEAVIGQLKLIKNIYNHLYETSELVVWSFGYSQLMNFLQNFVQLTCDLYWIYSVLYKNNFVNIWEEVCTIIPTFLMMTIVLHSCEQCLRQIRLIGFLLHNIEKDADNQTFNLLIENFSLQILHEPFEFSVTGFFAMDFTLLKSLVAAITTYMVILIQFMDKDEPQPLLAANATLNETTVVAVLATSTVKSLVTS